MSTDDKTQPLPTTPGAYATRPLPAADAAKTREGTDVSAQEPATEILPTADGAGDEAAVTAADGHAAPADHASPADAAAPATEGTGSADTSPPSGYTTGGYTTDGYTGGHAPGVPTGAWMPSSPAPREPRPVSTAVRTSTIVWGAILVVAAIVVLATAAGMTLDLELVGIFVLGGAGLALLVGTVATQARRQR